MALNGSCKGLKSNLDCLCHIMLCYRVFPSRPCLQGNELAHDVYTVPCFRPHSAHFIFTGKILILLLEFLGIEAEPVNIDTENGEPVIIDIEYDDRIQMPSVPSRNESPADRSFVYAMSFKDQMTNTIARIRSLQCWAHRWNVFVSSPFRTCDSGIRFLRYICGLISS